MMRDERMIGAALALLGLSWPAFAQTDDPQTKTKQTPQYEHPGTSSAKDACFVHKIGDFLGADVKNLQNEDLGEIQELVIHPETGEIQYAVLSFGGFLGIGDKLFAIPWDLLESIHQKDGDPSHFLLSVDKERLKESPGFPKDDWPDMSSPEWSDSIRAYYADDLRGRDSSAIASRAAQASQKSRLLKVSDIKGCEVDTSDGSDAGQISELAIDPNRGRVAFFVLSSGGFLGFGNDLYAIPWEAATFSLDEDKELVCKLDVPKAKFEKAPPFKDDEWQRMSDPVYVKEVYGYYSVPTYWKDVVEAGSR